MSEFAGNSTLFIGSVLSIVLVLSTELTNKQVLNRKPSERAIRLREGAKALAVRNGHVLLIKERHTDGSVFWTLPGGGKQSGQLLRGQAPELVSGLPF